MYFFFFFFFSSRRRHTRSLRDWSSDVCSSDLRGRGGGHEDRSGHRVDPESDRRDEGGPRRRAAGRDRLMGFLDTVLGRKGAAPARRSDDDLFDDDFQRKLDYLALVSKRVFAGRMRAERRTKKTGSGVEFADHREYQPGDDFRYLDVSVFQRFDRLLLRLYEEEEDLSIYFIVDAS